MKIGKHFYLLSLHCEMKGSSLKNCFSLSCCFLNQGNSFQFIVFFLLVPSNRRCLFHSNCRYTCLWWKMVSRVPHQSRQTEMGSYYDTQLSEHTLCAYQDEVSCRVVCVHTLRQN